jgi:beta-lactamase class D
MGYNEGVFQTETTPQWPYKEEYGENRSFMLEAWKGPQTPKTWIQYSCVWFSQVFTQLLGQDKFKDYLEEFNYGNQDASGDPGKNNGLTHCWLSSSLKISPLEQVAFLRKLLKKELPVSQEAHLLTQKILFLEELAPGWTLYGKTGSGDQEAWFVGWIKGPQNLVFSCCVQDKEKKGMVKSILAKDHAKALLLEFIQQNSL